MGGSRWVLKLGCISLADWACSGDLRVLVNSFVGKIEGVKECEL
jgi:hypothetical protein